MDASAHRVRSARSTVRPVRSSSALAATSGKARPPRPADDVAAVLDATGGKSARVTQRLARNPSVFICADLAETLMVDTTAVMASFHPHGCDSAAESARLEGAPPPEVVDELQITP